MKTWFQRALIFFAGIALGVVAGWEAHKFDSGFGEAIQRQILQNIPAYKVSQLAAEFGAHKDRPPKDSEELAHFAMEQAMEQATNELDLSKFSVLRFEPVSNRTAIVIWQLAPPAQGGGTNTISWGNSDTNAQPSSGANAASPRRSL